MEGIMSAFIVKMTVKFVNETENKTKHHDLFLMVFSPGNNIPSHLMHIFRSNIPPPSFEFKN